MKEDFFKIGYSAYLNNNKKQKWTSLIFEKIAKHKLIFAIIFIALICATINFWLIFKFMYVLEASAFVY